MRIDLEMGPEVRGDKIQVTALASVTCTYCAKPCIDADKELDLASDPPRGAAPAYSNADAFTSLSSCCQAVEYVPAGHT